jgi:hypothetical protein
MRREDESPCMAGCPGAVGLVASCGKRAATWGERSVAAKGVLDTAGWAGVGTTAPTTADWGPLVAAAGLTDRLAVPVAADCLAAARRADCRGGRKEPCPPVPAGTGGGRCDAPLLLAAWPCSMRSLASEASVGMTVCCCPATVRKPSNTGLSTRRTLGSNARDPVAELARWGAGLLAVTRAAVLLLPMRSGCSVVKASPEAERLRSWRVGAADPCWIAEVAGAELFTGISPAFLSGYAPRTGMPADPGAWLSDACAGVA